MFESVNRSFGLIKESFNVLKKDKKLIVFPIVSGIALVAVFLSFMIPLSMVGIEDMPFGKLALLVFSFYLMSYFVIIFFNAALVECADMSFSGKKPTLGKGLEASAKHIVNIFGWAIIAATVGLILRLLANEAQEKEGIMGIIAQIVVGMIGMVWSLLTFFVIPVMIFEGLGPIKAIKRSSSLIKHTWGENVIADASMGLGFFILALVGAIPVGIMWYLGVFGTTFLVVLGVTILYWLGLAILSSSLNGIFIAAMYRYAKDGKMPSVYSAGASHHFHGRKR